MQKRRQGRFVVKSKRGRGKSNALGEEITWQKKGGVGRGELGESKSNRTLYIPVSMLRQKKYVKKGRQQKDQ